MSGRVAAVPGDLVEIPASEMERAIAARHVVPMPDVLDRALVAYVANVRAQLSRFQASPANPDRSLEIVRLEPFKSSRRLNARFKS